jgi:hypothetical protein
MPATRSQVVALQARPGVHAVEPREQVGRRRRQRQKVGYGDSAEPIVQDLLARTPAVIAEVHATLPAGFSTRVAKTILGGLEQAAKALREMPAA